MEILNIGPLELILFLVIAFILLGPKGMVVTAYKIGQWIRQTLRSPMWREILRSAQEIREFPTKIMDETGLQAELNAIRSETQAAVNEVNGSLKEVTGTLQEVKDSVRVPEAEHLRLNDDRLSNAMPIQPTSAMLGRDYHPESVVETPEISNSASVDSAPAASVMVGQSPAAWLQAVTPIVEEKSAAVVVVDPSIPAPVLNEQTENVEKPARKPRAARKKKEDVVDGAISVQLADETLPGTNGNGAHAANAEVIAEKPARKPRTPRKKAVENAATSDMQTDMSSPEEISSSSE